MKQLKRFVIFSMILAVVLGACIGETPANTGNNNANANQNTANDSSGDTGEDAPNPTATPTESPGSQPEPSGPTVDDCPETTGTLVSFIHPGHGYCFLVPSGYSAQISSGNVFFTGKLYGELETLSPTMGVVVEPANGRTTADFAAEQATLSGALDTPQPINLGGLEAMILTQIPARFASINVMLVHNDLAYLFVVSPYEYGATPTIDPEKDAQAAWAEIENSIVFFTPQPGQEPQTNLEGCTLDSEFVSDISIPDGTQYNPGAYMIKRWLIRNSGTCAWGPGFEFYQTNTDSALLARLETSYLPMAAPGAEVEVSVVLTLSDTASVGEHYARFAMRTADGEKFGATPYALVQSFSAATSPCVIPTNGEFWHINEDVGVCFTYTNANFTVEGIDTTSMRVIYKPPNQCTACDEVSYVLTIIRIGDVGGMSLQDFADQQIATHDTSIAAPTVSNIQIQGNPAIYAEGLDVPARFGTTEAYVIVNSVGYVLRLYPENLTESNVLWDEIVLGTLQFFR